MSNTSIFLPSQFEGYEIEQDGTNLLITRFLFHSIAITF